ncbi:MAG: DUF6717 family protein [Xenococcaceae cyanobacterium]
MNSIRVIHPYFYEGLWVFDDEKVGLDKEPFVSGSDTIIEKIIETKGIKNAAKGFTILFSDIPFPGHDFKFVWLKEEGMGNWYKISEFNMEGWLCPALFKYFDMAPKEIYAQFKSKPNNSPLHN